MKLRSITAAVAAAALISGAASAGPSNTYSVTTPSLTDVLWGTHGYTGSGTGTTNNFTVQSVLGLLSSGNVTAALGYTPAHNGANSDITSLTGITTPLSVAQGGLGISAGTSGGVPCYTAAATVASSAALTAGGVIVGGGAGACPAVIANGQLPGTTTNDSATAGNVGEFVSSNIASGSAVSLSTGTAANVTSVSLTAGDWDCRGTVGYKAGTGTVSTALRGWVGSASAAEPTDAGSGAHFVIIGQSFTDTTTAPILPTGMIRESLSSTTTVYLGAAATFGTSTLTAYGFLGCRRVR